VWRIVADPGSTPIAAATEARALPPVSVRARVTGRGPRRTLRYRIKPVPGQKVTFAETSVASRVAHVIGVARGRRGTLRFVPGHGPAGRRRIVAQVSQRGLPRAERTVARYRAPGPLRLARPRGVKFRRAAGSLQIRWRAVKGARGYEVLVTTVNRRRELFRLGSPGRRRTVTMARVLRRDRVVVRITPLDGAHRPGRSTRAVALGRRG
jgi:hypothetical protein